MCERRWMWQQLNSTKTVITTSNHNIESECVYLHIIRVNKCPTIQSQHNNWTKSITHTLHIEVRCRSLTKIVRKYTQRQKGTHTLYVIVTKSTLSQFICYSFIRSIVRLYLYFCCWCSSSSSFISPIQLKLFVLRSFVRCFFSVFVCVSVSLFKLNCIVKSSKRNARHAAQIKEKKRIIIDHIETAIE